MSDKVWVVHLDDAAPSSGFEGVCRTLEGAKRLVAQRYEEDCAATDNAYPSRPPTERKAITWSGPSVYGSWEAQVAWRTYLVSEEELRD